MGLGLVVTGLCFVLGPGLAGVWSLTLGGLSVLLVGLGAGLLWVTWDLSRNAKMPYVDEWRFTGVKVGYARDLVDDQEWCFITTAAGDCYVALADTLNEAAWSIQTSQLTFVFCGDLLGWEQAGDPIEMCGARDPEDAAPEWDAFDSDGEPFELRVPGWTRVPTPAFMT